MSWQLEVIISISQSDIIGHIRDIVLEPPCSFQLNNYHFFEKPGLKLLY